MEPLNKAARSVAFQKFIGVYLFTLLIPLLASFILFYAPSDTIKKQNAQLNAELEEQRRLLVKMDDMGLKLQTLEQIDKDLLGKSNEMDRAQSLKRVKEHENDLELLVADTRRDSAQLVAELSKRTARDMIISMNSLLTYRNTIALLRETNTGEGDKALLIEQLNSDLRDSKNKLENCQMLLAMKPQPQSQAGGGGGDSKKVMQLENQVRLNEDKIKAYEEKITGLQKQLANSSSGSAPVTVENTGKIEDLEIKLAMAYAYCDEGKADIRNMGCDQRKKLYESAINAFLKLQSSHKPDIKQEARKKVEEIKHKLKRVCE